MQNKSLKISIVFLGGVVKVEIYEADTKIALKVDTFSIECLGRHWTMCFMSTLNIVIVDIKTQVIFCRPKALSSILT